MPPPFPKKSKKKSTFPRGRCRPAQWILFKSRLGSPHQWTNSRLGLAIPSYCLWHSIRSKSKEKGMSQTSSCDKWSQLSRNIKAW